MSYFCKLANQSAALTHKTLRENAKRCCSLRNGSHGKSWCVSFFSLLLAARHSVCRIGRGKLPAPVLAAQICSTKTANSRTRLTIIHSRILLTIILSGIFRSDVSSIHKWNSSSEVCSNWATKDVTQLTGRKLFTLRRFAAVYLGSQFQSRPAVVCFFFWSKQTAHKHQILLRLRCPIS